MQQDDQIKNESRIKEAIMKELDLEGLDDEKQNEIISKMGEVILKRIFFRIMEKLNDDSRKEFEEMMSQEVDSEQLESFLSEKIPDFEKITQEIVVELKDELKSVE
ncbi:DUF5663 domain-containing protein [Patescibacteria group bacterium]